MTMLDAVLERPDSLSAASRLNAATAFRLLVADDQREVTDALRLLLAGHDFTVHAASSPAEAIAVARTTPLDAAIIDLNYEKGRTSGDQGLDLLTALLRHDPLLPVVGMTAWSSMDLVSTALRRGARDVIEKPWDEARLVALLRSQAELGRALKRVSELEGEVQQLRAGLPGGAGTDAAPVNGMRLLEVEGMLVRRAMEKHQGNVSRAARTLGLSRSALYRRLERHKI